MSSHREAPEISKDPVSDSTDLYAFVSPDSPTYVTLIANYVPLQLPAGGPNFYEFGTDVVYEIHIDNEGQAEPNITYQFRFSTEVTDPGTFLYNTTPIKSLSSPGWNRRQFYSVTRIDRRGTHVIAKHLACPPCNIGPLSTPNYAKNLAAPAVHWLQGGGRVFAGQRAEGFYVDLGSIFDLGNLRPIQEYNVYAAALGLKSALGVNSTKYLNVHSIAIQVPIKQLVARSNRPVIGVWTTASKRRVGILSDGGDAVAHSGPWTQVSRLGNPLINEVIIPMGKKDYWNTQQPHNDKQFANYVAHPELAGLIAALYSPNFPHLAKAVAQNVVRADLEAILLTGIPAGVVPKAPAFTNFTGPVQADMLRLNTSIAPSISGANPLGVVAGDLAGFPNGRRVFDDVVTVELRAVAGLLLGLTDPGYSPDAAVGLITDGVSDSGPIGPGTPYLNKFPYLGVPYDGYDHPPLA
jgi:Domain of unknown function (DUF4331)